MMRTYASAPSDHQLKVLQGICHSFGSSADAPEIMGRTGRWVRAGLGSQGVALRFLLPDALGRLRSIHVDGENEAGGRKRSARRRLSFLEKTPVRLDLDETGRSLAILPLVVRGEAIGVLEVAGPRLAMDERWETLLAIASQVAIALRHARDRTRLRQEVEMLEKTVVLGRDLVRRRSPERAVGAAVRFLHEQGGAPVAGWVIDEDPTQLTLVHVRGAGTTQRKQVRSRMGAMPEWSSLPAAERDRRVDLFARIMGLERVETIAAAHMLVLVGEVPGLPHSLTAVVGSLLEEVLVNMRAVASAERRDEQLDLGIAWTAHEFRGPLLGVKAVLELLLSADQSPPAHREMLHRSLNELEQLDDLVERVLRWAVGAGPLQPESVAAIGIVRDAAESCRLETGGRPVSVTGDAGATIWVDPHHVRGAVANVIRNALSYSPPGEAVDVAVKSLRDRVRITVRDRGPGISPDRREKIFDPFVRGGNGNGLRNGSGLGLFIARRVVEAHGGAIGLDSSERGATFRIELPASR